MGKTPHTITQRGKWCRVKLKDGTVFLDQFVERTAGKRVIFTEHSVPAGDIQSMSDYKPINRSRVRQV